MNQVKMMITYYSQQHMYHTQQVTSHPTTEHMEVDWQASDTIMEVDLKENEEDTIMKVDSEQQEEHLTTYQHMYCNHSQQLMSNPTIMQMPVDSDFIMEVNSEQQHEDMEVDSEGNNEEEDMEVDSEQQQVEDMEIDWWL